MKWTYILVHSEEFMDHEEVRHFLNAREDISSWLHAFENTFFFISNNTAVSLGEALLQYVRKNRGKRRNAAVPGLYVLTEMAKDRQGYLQKAVWNLVDGKDPDATDELQLPGDADDELPF